jgi:hypothetical protein
MSDVDWKTWLPRVSPALALGLGVYSQVNAGRTISFAPKAVALLVVAWAVAAGAGEWLPEARPDEPHARWRNLLRLATATIAISLFRNVLFFLVPVWFTSSTLTSINIVAPLALAAAAGLSCFPNYFRAHVLDRPRARTLWSSSVLFAALVPATAVEISASPRLSLALAAAISWVVASLVSSREVLETKQGRLVLARGAGIAALACALAAPILPPVPVASLAAVTGTSLHSREVDGIATRFPAGTKRVVAWFAIQAPRNYRQGLRFAWYRDGEPAGHIVAKDVVGGREQGFRTSSFTTAPQPGSWRVDLLTDASQLIGRTRFTVE